MIYFREANEPHVPQSDAGRYRYWHLECYEFESKLFPVGVAYVVEVGDSAQLQFIFVADQWRRRGFGKEIIIAAKQRWPDLQWTEAIDELGAALLASVGMIADDE